MANLLLLGICLLAGVLFQRVKNFPPNAHIALNNTIIYLALPALTLLYIPQVKFNAQVLQLVGISWIIFAGALIFILAAGKLFNISKATQGGLILTAGLGNTSFVGVPVMDALYGGEGIRLALIIDQPGTFVVLSTLGIIVASAFSTGTVSVRKIVKRVVVFPPFIALIIAIGLNMAGYQHPPLLADVLQKIGSTISVLALVSVGLQLKPDFSVVKPKALALGLVYKLVLAPLLIYFIYVVLAGYSGTIAKVAILEAAMAPMITAAIVAAEHELNPPLTSLMVGLGIPLSFLSLAGWYLFIQHL
jgi:malate permease and related proteins